MSPLLSRTMHGTYTVGGGDCQGRDCVISTLSYHTYSLHTIEGIQVSLLLSASIAIQCSRSARLGAKLSPLLPSGRPTTCESCCSPFPHINILHSSVVHCTLLYCIALYCSALQCTLLYCTALYCTALHCTVVHYSVVQCIAVYCGSLHCSVI